MIVAPLWSRTSNRYADATATAQDSTIVHFVLTRSSGVQIEPGIIENTESTSGGRTDALHLRLGQGTLERSDGDLATL